MAPGASLSQLPGNITALNGRACIDAGQTCFSPCRPDCHKNRSGTTEPGDGSSTDLTAPENRPAQRRAGIFRAIRLPPALPSRIPVIIPAFRYESHLSRYILSPTSPGHGCSARRHARGPQSVDLGQRFLHSTSSCWISIRCGVGAGLFGPSSDCRHPFGHWIGFGPHCAHPTLLSHNRKQPFALFRDPDSCLGPVILIIPQP